MTLKDTLLRTLPMSLMAIVLIYCGYFATFGKSGFFMLDKYEAQEAALSAQVDEAKAHREALEGQVKRLRPETLDWDLVDQEATRKLGPRDAHKKSLNM